jgi:hypothetical protein
MGMIRARAGGGMRKQEETSAEDDRDEVQDDLAARQFPSPKSLSLRSLY